GVFSQRFDNHLLKHSSLICIDFDHLTEKDILKEKLLQDEYFETELLFTSPYGDGLKWVIGIEITSYTHLENFLGIESYIKKVYGYKIDTSCKDLSRACFLPHDPEVFINTKYLLQ
ncbi:MAG: VirE protein, partial [Cytophagales bacterium]|nr:VirE protein [Cytophagales bacterium]